MADADSSIRVPVEADLSAFSGALDDLSKQSRQFASVFTGTMRSAVTSGRSFEDTLRSMALKLSGMALTAGLKPLEGLLGNALQGVLGAGARAFPAAPAGITPFAKGGVVASPTYFQATGGAGVMGEAGAEAILPLARGADGRLGVRGAGGGGAAPVQVTFNISTPDVAGFQRSQTQISAMLARAVGRGGRAL